MKSDLSMHLLNPVIVVLLLASCTSGLCATATIDIPYDNTLGNFVSNPYNSDTMGQTFIAPINTSRLLDFSFWTRGGYESTNDVSFKGYIMEWDGMKATGPMLYQSDIRSSTKKWGEGTERFDFNTGGIDLVTGRSYIAFLSAIGCYTTPPDHNAWLYLMIDFYDPQYEDGRHVYTSSHGSYATLASSDWVQNQGVYDIDLGFHATFTEIPEPSSIIALLCGTGSLTGMILRRKLV